MASSYSPLLRFELIGSGEQAGLWGSSTNVNLGQLVEQAIAGVGSIYLASSADYTLTSLNGAPDNARNAVLSFTGATGLTATNIIIPASQKLYVVRNASGADLKFKTAAQVSSLTVKNGDATLVFCDGASALSGIVTTNVGTISVSGGGTGVATFTAGVVKSPGGTANLTTGAVALGSATEVSGTLGVANGGTGVVTLPPNGLLIGNGVSAVTTLSGTSIGQVATWNGTSWTSVAPTVGSVGSVFGRTGAVAAQSSDYQEWYALKGGTNASGSWPISITGGSATAVTCTGNAGSVTNGVYLNVAQNITGNKQFSGGLYGGGISSSTSGVYTLHNASSASYISSSSIYDGRAIFYQGGTYGNYVGSCATFIYTGSNIGSAAGFSIGKTSDFFCAFTYDSDPFTAAYLVGKITTPDGVNTVYGTTSDYRLKTILGGITDAVDKIKRLNPVRFKWKSNDALAPVDGFLAHEIQEIYPGAVSGQKDEIKPDGDIVPQSLDTSFLVPLLTAALQNALSRIEALEAKVGV
jgi:hypothetical protein